MTQIPLVNIAPEDAEVIRKLSEKYGLRSIYMDTPPAPVCNVSHGGVCPDCGARVTHESGCATCHACGYSLCG